MQDFNHFIRQLQVRFEKPLPGRPAHEKMISSNRLLVKAIPNAKTRRSAVLILFYPYEGEIYLPLILRPAYDGVHGGQMAFPGGRMEKEDENLIRTAMREAQEEIGIRLTDVRIIGELTELFIPPSNFFVQPVIGYLTSRPEFYPDAREVEDVIEVNLKELRNIDIIGREVMNVRGVDVDAPFYNIQNRKIWGATAMMIAELLELLQSEQF